MKRSSGSVLILVLGLILLFLLNCYLFRQNIVYRTQNRALILQNDSLIAVTIELKRKITVPERNTVQKSQLQYRK